MGKYNILVGNITNDEILKGHDLIINPSNPAMLFGSGVCGAIFKKAGIDELEAYTQKTFDINYFTENINRDNLMKIGDVRITPGFNLGMDIMFVQGPKKWTVENPLDVLKGVYINVLKELENNKYKSILLPSIATGVYGYEHEEVGKMLSDLIKDFVKDKDINIDLVLYKEEDKQYYL